VQQTLLDFVQRFVLRIDRAAFAISVCPSSMAMSCRPVLTRTSMGGMISGLAR
jgi:hypothetical protein